MALRVVMAELSLEARLENRLVGVRRMAGADPHRVHPATACAGVRGTHPRG
jgi:hypothetical protein